MRQSFIVTSLAIFTMSISSFAFAYQHRLDSFGHLLSALRAGDDVRAIISLDKCQKLANSTDTNQEDLTGVIVRMNFSIFNHYKVPDNNNQLRNTIATSYSTLTEHRDFGPVQGYARLRVFRR